VVEYIGMMAGSRFDPTVVAALVRIFERGELNTAARLPVLLPESEAEPQSELPFAGN